MRVVINIPDALGEEVEKLAAGKGVSASSLYAKAVERHVNRLKREEVFDAVEQLIGTPVAPDFDEQLAELRADDPERLA